MKLENSFEVAAPPEKEWALLMDVPRIVPCMPGATIHPGWVLRCDVGVSGDQMPGTVVSLYPFGGCSRSSE